MGRAEATSLATSMPASLEESSSAPVSTRASLLLAPSKDTSSYTALQEGGASSSSATPAAPAPTGEGFGRRLRRGLAAALSRLGAAAPDAGSWGAAPSPALAEGPVLEAVVELLGCAALPGSFLPVCRQWFTAAVCHPCSFREPVEAWRIGACRQLDEQLARMREPPADEDVGDLRVGLQHAEEELRLTELSASFPSGITVVLLRYARRLGGLLHWINGGGGSATSSQRQRHLRHEALEFRRRVLLLADAMRELRSRLPDPEMPMRWAQWFEEAGEVAGLPVNHCSRYRSQREQVAAVWANNQRTFYSTDEHVDALAQSLAELDELAEDSGDESLEAPKRARLSCGAGLGLLCRRPRRQ